MNEIIIEERFDKIEKALLALADQKKESEIEVPKADPADLNGDGVVTASERFIYKAVIEKMQKYNIYSQSMMIGFLLLSALFSALGVPI